MQTERASKIVCSCVWSMKLMCGACLRVARVLAAALSNVPGGASHESDLGSACARPAQWPVLARTTAQQAAGNGSVRSLLADSVHAR